MNAREGSIWGWGHADKFPDLESRRAFGEGVSARLGGPALEPLEPAPVPRLPPPRVHPPAALAPLCSSERTDRAAHTYGKG